MRDHFVCGARGVRRLGFLALPWNSICLQVVSINCDLCDLVDEDVALLFAVDGNEGIAKLVFALSSPADAVFRLCMGCATGPSCAIATFRGGSC